MKTMLLFHIILIALYGCSMVSSNTKTEEFIPGTYIRFSAHEYGTECDTLVITLQNKSANEYQILRKWKYERILDGKKIEPEYQRLTTTGIYSGKQKVMQETETGELYSFDVEQRILFNGSTKYQKL